MLNFLVNWLFASILVTLAIVMSIAGLGILLVLVKAIGWIPIAIVLGLGFLIALVTDDEI